MSAPFWTGRAELRLEGDTLVAANGGWFCESGPIGGYVFVFTRDDGRDYGTRPPARETHEAARTRLASSGNAYSVKDFDRDHRFTVDCYAVTFSGAWGTEQAWAEWGSKAATDRLTEPNRSASVYVPGLEPEPTPAPPPSGLYAPSEAKRNIVAEVEKYRVGRADSLVAPTRLYFIELLALDRDDARWKRIGPQLFELLRS